MTNEIENKVTRPEKKRKSRVALGAGTLLAPLPAVLVTVRDGERDNVITIGWTGILSTHPARMYISVRKSRHSYEMLKASGEFVVNLTTKPMLRATDMCGIYTGGRIDKFQRASLGRCESTHVGAPTLEDSPIALECRVFDIIESGTHDIFMADILGVSVREDIIDADGKICLERAQLIAYAHGEYFALTGAIGKFGFSATRKRKNTSRR